MKRKSFWHVIILGLLLLPGLPATAEELLMARVPMTFPEAMLKLQSTINKQISRRTISQPFYVLLTLKPNRSKHNIL